MHRYREKHVRADLCKSKYGPGRGTYNLPIRPSFNRFRHCPETYASGKFQIDISKFATWNVFHSEVEKIVCPGRKMPLPMLRSRSLKIGFRTSGRPEKERSFVPLARKMTALSCPIENQQTDGQTDKLTENFFTFFFSTLSRPVPLADPYEA